MVEVVLPSAVIDVGEAVIKEVAGSAPPEIKLTVALSVIAAAFTVPVTIAVPVVTAEVRVAV